MDEETKNISTLFFYLFAAFFIIFSVMVLTSCTYSITQVHTEGADSGDVSEAQTNTPTTNASATIPLK